ncbi:MAG TPA: hypothetical protein VES88_12240 [Gemmatimonadaceae bacterium]|nr:hypothetical protein [Gemmatimonadaceae bacterium]
MHVAVITTFVELFEAFSLCNVVSTQLQMLRHNGHHVTFVAGDGFMSQGAYAHPAIEQIRLPVLHVTHESDLADRPAAFRSDVDFVKGRLRPAIERCDVAITHDILYLLQHLAYNIACRELALEFPNVRWLHWIHSAAEAHVDFPRGDPRRARFTPFPFGTIVYPNRTDAFRVAQQFGLPEDAVAVVPHAIDIAECYGFHPLTRAMVEHFGLERPDVLSVYPTRLDRGKQAERAVRLFAEIKRAGASVALVIANFHSTGERFVRYREEISAEAARLGLTPNEVVFTSNLPPLPGMPGPAMTRTAIELPHQVVQDLFRLTNVYVHPSASETYSLVCQEAAIAGNLLVLNEDFPAMRELYGDAALYAHFCSSQMLTVYAPNEAAYFSEVARDILAQFELNPTLAQRTRIRQTRNLRAVYDEHFGPVLEAARASVSRAG